MHGELLGVEQPFPDNVLGEGCIIHDQGVVERPISLLFIVIPLLITALAKSREEFRTFVPSLA